MSFRSGSDSFQETRELYRDVSSENLQRLLENGRWKVHFQAEQRPRSSSDPVYKNSGHKLPTDSIPYNLIEVRDGRFFFWNEENSAVLTTIIAEAELENVAILECDVAPLFDVTSISLSPNGSSVALVGPRGISILDLESEDLIPESGRKLARCIAISERFFLNNPKVTVLQAEWFPFRETHIVILTSDNFLRVYKISNPAQPELIINLHGSTTKRSLQNFSAFTLAQSNMVNSYGISGITESPRKGSATVAVYALKSDGNIFTCDITAGNDRTVTSMLRGPLSANAPFVGDFAQLATSILFIDAALPVLLIATNTQKIIHGILVQKDDMEVNSERELTGVLAAKHEFLQIERVELRSAQESVRRHRPASFISSPKFPNCYVYATDRELFGITLPWIDDLQLLVSDSIDVDSLRQSCVQTVYSLNPFEDQDELVLLGARLTPTDMDESSLVSIASNGQVALQKLSQPPVIDRSNSWIESPNFLSQPNFSASKTLARRGKPSNEVPFNEYISNILRRDQSLPSFSVANPDQVSEDNLRRIVDQGMQVFEEQYVNRQRQAHDEIQSRKLRNETRKKQLLQMVEKLEDKVEELNNEFYEFLNQKDRLNIRMAEMNDWITSLQADLARCNPTLSDAEKQLQVDLRELDVRMEAIELLMETVQRKLNFRERRVHSSSSIKKPERGFFDSQLDSDIQHLANMKTKLQELKAQLNF